jgi:hypothetical protein
MASKSGISGQTSSFLHNLVGGEKAPISDSGRKAGEVVFSAEAFQVLKKMEILRMERNNKREERRKAGDRDVSDDEGDDLAPYLMVVPSGENPQPNDTPDIPSKSTDQGSAVTKLLFDDNVAEKNTFRAQDDTILVAIYSLAKNGISPPLTLFLPASLERIRTSNVKTVKHGTGETTKVTVLDVSDFPSEETLDQATWLTCYNTFLTFLDTAAGLKILQGFARHYNRILADPELATWFPAYRNFDRTIRARFFTIPFIVDIDSPEYRSALQSSKDTFLLASHSAKGSGSTGFRSFAGPNSSAPKERSDRGKPYDRDNSTSCRSKICFRCGRTGHGAVGCSESDPSKHGRRFVIYANRDGLFRITNNTAVCTGFNIGRCESAGRNHPIHICALCADPQHGAIDCTRN